MQGRQHFHHGIDRTTGPTAALLAALARGYQALLTTARRVHDKLRPQAHGEATTLDLPIVERIPSIACIRGPCYLDEREAVARVARALVAPGELEQVADTVVEQARRTLGVDTAAVWLADESARELNLLAQSGVPQRRMRSLQKLSYDAGLLTTKAALEGAVLEVSDVERVAEDLAASKEIATQDGTMSILSLPLNARGRLVGVMTCTRRTAHHYSEGERSLAMTLADLFAVAIERAQFAEARRDAVVHRLDGVLSGMGRIATLSDGSLNGVLGEIAAVARELVEAELAAVQLAQPNGTWGLLVPVGPAEDQVAETAALVRDSGLLARVADASQPLRVCGEPSSPPARGQSLVAPAVAPLGARDGLDCLTAVGKAAEQSRAPSPRPPDVRLPGGGDSGAHRSTSGLQRGGAEIRSFLGVPIRRQDRLLGVIYGVNKADGCGFSEEDARVVEVLVAHAAVAVENARLLGELKSALRMREEFLSAAAHELKTPVTALRGYAQIMMGLPESGHVLERQAREAILHSSERIARLVHGVLEASAIDSGKATLRFTSFDLCSLAREVIDDVQLTTRRHRLLLHGPTSTLVLADRDRLAEVISGLLDNAIKFSPQGKSIEVVIKGARRGHPETVLGVRDHGVGIPLSRQAHVFEPLYEPHPSGSPGYVGIVGISLFLSKQIVEAHGGRIWFESVEGKGSTFWIALPKAVRNTLDQRRTEALSA